MVSDKVFIFHTYTCIFLRVKAFFSYHSQGHLSRSRLNIKVTVLEKMAVEGAFMFYKHILVFFFFFAFLQSDGFSISLEIVILSNQNDKIIQRQVENATMAMKLDQIKVHTCILLYFYMTVV